MHILLVAADADHEDFLDFLREAGHQVTTAGTAMAALEHPALGQCDAVIVDEDLPDASGFELIARLKRDRLAAAHRPVVMLVQGHVGSDLARRHGADSVIFKNTEHLLAASGLSALLCRSEPDPKSAADSGKVRATG